MTKVMGAVWVVLALGIVGCGGAATHLHRGTFGGIIHVPQAADLAHAELLMAEHCGGRFEVVRSEESGVRTVDGPEGGERLEYVCARARTASRR